MNKAKSYLFQKPFFQTISSYTFAASIVVASTLVLFIFREQLNTSTVALLFLVPVLISTILWGFGPGILSALIAFLSYNFVFLLPYYTFVVHESQDVVALAIFLVVAILISQLVGRAKSGLQLAIAREQESTRLYEYSLALAGVNDLKEIASVIVNETAETFLAEAVEISVDIAPGERAFSVHSGARDFKENKSPISVVPLETIRGFLGEIRLWRDEPPLSGLEERMLSTFAAQGALALERAALEQAERRAKVLEESDRLKTALLSSVSHEFRTPLVTIKAGITSLLNGQVDWDTAARQELLAVVDEEADHLNHLVGNLLDMSRIESGAMKPNRQWNLLSEIVGDSVVRMRRALVNHRLRVEIPDDLPLIPVDYVQLERVFTNLIGNSAKYAPEGSEIAIHARLSKEDALLVQLINQGPPVAPEHLDRIFDKFFRVTNAEKVSGTGLGLSICKGIIEAHGGKIWAENLQEGFSFCMTLPLTWGGVRPPVVKSDGL
jgi:two-component system, OmpR family, sensor histidine kinase KdpD